MNSSNTISDWSSEDFTNIENEWNPEFPPSVFLFKFIEKYNTLDEKIRKEQHWKIIKQIIFFYIQGYNLIFLKEFDFPSDIKKQLLNNISIITLNILKKYLITEKSIQSAISEMNSIALKLLDDNWEIT